MRPWHFSAQTGRYFVLAAAAWVILGGPAPDAGAPSGTIWRVAKPALARPYRPPHNFQRLGIDYVNDEFEVPHAFSVTEGTLSPDRLGGFRLYGITHQEIYEDLTAYFRYSPRLVRVKARAAPGSRSVAGKLLFSGSSNTLYYSPLRKMRVDRTAILTFTLHGDPLLRQEFRLHLPASE